MANQQQQSPTAPIVPYLEDARDTVLDYYNSFRNYMQTDESNIFDLKHQGRDKAIRRAAEGQVPRR